MTWSLPLDVFFDIIDELASIRDFTTLQALSLTCKDLVPLCQRALFYSIQINANRFDALSNLQDVIQDSSHIATYVRTLGYCISADDSEDEDFLLVLARVMVQFSRLIVLRLICSDSKPLDWIQFSGSLNGNRAATELSRAIENVLQMRQLFHLQVLSIDNFPIAILTRQARVLDIAEQNRSCFMVTMIDRLPAQSSSMSVCQVRDYNTNLQGSEITSFDGRFHLKFQNSPSCLIDLQALRSLFLDFEVPRNSDLLNILQTARSLSQLSFRVKSRSAEALRLLTETISLGYLGSIDTLKLSLCAQRQSHRMIMSLCNALEALSGSNVVRHLNIFLEHQDSSYASYGRPKSKIYRYLHRLGTILNMTGYPHLEKFKFSVEIELGKDTLDAKKEQKLKTNVATLFPQLRAASGLEFQCSTKIYEYNSD